MIASPSCLLIAVLLTAAGAQGPSVPSADGASLLSIVSAKPATSWFDMDDSIRRQIVQRLAPDRGYLDVFTCVTLFASDDENRGEPLANAFWLCQSPAAN